jgi:17beta-estradiol 17-dehydrogenase / very-long-chain 3-oxoacyl-CoA reductase
MTRVYLAARLHLETAELNSDNPLIAIKFFGSFAAMISQISQVVGTLFLALVLYRIAAFIYLYFIRKSTLQKYLRADGQAYVLVTGATDGVGLALVKLLLKKGFNVVMHGRSEEKLKRIRSQLRSDFPDQKIEHVAADATDPAIAVPKVAGAVGKIEGRGGKLTILINNLGGQGLFGERTFNAFQNIPLNAITATINLNGIFPIQLTRVLFSSLEASPPGLIINIGSYSGKYAVPLGSAYSSAKAMLHHFTRVLAAETYMNSTPVEVLGIMTAQVLTRGQGGDHTSFTILTPETMAESVLARVGCGYDIVTGSWRHAISAEMAKWMPLWLERFAARSEVIIMAKKEDRKLSKSK